MLPQTRTGSIVQRHQRTRCPFCSDMIPCLIHRNTHRRAIIITCKCQRTCTGQQGQISCCPTGLGTTATEGCHRDMNQGGIMLSQHIVTYTPCHKAANRLRLNEEISTRDKTQKDLSFGINVQFDAAFTSRISPPIQRKLRVDPSFKERTLLSSCRATGWFDLNDICTQIAKNLRA